MVIFTVLGLLGGCAWVLNWAKGWEELKSFEATRRIILGGIIGFLYNFLHSDYSFPNSVMAFVAGYMGTDFIAGLLERFKKKPEG